MAAMELSDKDETHEVVHYFSNLTLTQKTHCIYERKEQPRSDDEPQGIRLHYAWAFPSFIETSEVSSPHDFKNTHELHCPYIYFHHDCTKRWKLILKFVRDQFNRVTWMKLYLAVTVIERRDDQLADIFTAKVAVNVENTSHIQTLPELVHIRHDVQEDELEIKQHEFLCYKMKCPKIDIRLIPHEAMDRYHAREFCIGPDDMLTMNIHITIYDCCSNNNLVAVQRMTCVDKCKRGRRSQSCEGRELPQLHK